MNAISERNMGIITSAVVPYMESDLFKKAPCKIVITLDMNSGGISNIDVQTKKTFREKK